jgi:hypothetical protein
MRRAQSKRFAGCRIGRSHYDQHMEVSHLGCPFDKDPGDVIDNAYCHLEYDNRQDIWMPVCTVLYAEKSAGHVKQDTSGEHNIVHGQSTPAAPFFPSCHAPKCSSIASPLLRYSTAIIHTVLNTTTASCLSSRETPPSLSTDIPLGTYSFRLDIGVC